MKPALSHDWLRASHPQDQKEGMIPCNGPLQIHFKAIITINQNLRINKCYLSHTKSWGQRACYFWVSPNWWYILSCDQTYAACRKASIIVLNGDLIMTLKPFLGRADTTQHTDAPTGRNCELGQPKRGKLNYTKIWPFSTWIMSQYSTAQRFSMCNKHTVLNKFDCNRVIFKLSVNSPGQVHQAGMSHFYKPTDRNKKQVRKMLPKREIWVLRFHLTSAPKSLRKMWLHPEDNSISQNV